MARVFILKTSDFKAEIGLVVEATKLNGQGIQLIEIEFKMPEEFSSVACESDLKKENWNFEIQ